MTEALDEETVAALRAAVLVLARRLRYQVAGDDVPTPPRWPSSAGSVAAAR